MAAERVLKLTILGSAESAVKAAQSTRDAVSGVGDKLESVGQKYERYRLQAGLALGAVTAVGAKAVAATSSLAEAQNKANVVFEGHVGAIDAFAKTSANSFGISQRAALAYAGTIGQVLQTSGLTQEATAGMSTEVLKLAADLASFNDIGFDEALEKIRSGLVGEAEPLRSVGVLLSDAEVKAKAAALGLGDLSGALTEGEKVQARYAIIMEQTTKAQGDFARTADSTANAGRRVTAVSENLQAKLGSGLEPVVRTLTNAVLAVPEPVLAVAVGFGTVGTAVGALLIVLPLLVSGWAVATAGAATFGATLLALSANPFVLLGIALAAAVVAVVLLVKHWDEASAAISRAVDFAVSFILNHWELVIVLFGPAGPLLVAIAGVIRHWDELKEKVTAAVDFVVGKIDALIAKIKAIPRPDLGFLGDAAGAAGSAAGSVGGLFGRIPGFADGGIVPGPVGRPVLAVVHGGERVLSVAERRGGGGGATYVFAPRVEGSLLVEQELRETFLRWMNEGAKHGAFRGTLTA